MIFVRALRFWINSLKLDLLVIHVSPVITVSRRHKAFNARVFYSNLITAELF